jgi:hypothetical protein
MARVRSLNIDASKLTRIVSDDQACRDLRLYFGIGLSDKELPLYTGRRFEALDGGGDRDDVCNRFTASDILALKLLSVDLPARIAIDLLEGALGEEAAGLLRQIPASASLWDAGAVNLIEAGMPADILWRLLEQQDGAGWVTAGKLLARKRPMLIPVYDNVVRCAYDGPQNIWTALRDALRQESGFLEALNQLKLRSGVPSQVTPLRVLDVAVWMRHRPFHTGYRCSGLN